MRDDVYDHVVHQTYEMHLYSLSNKRFYFQPLRLMNKSKPGHVLGTLTHAGSGLCFGHSSRAAVETLVPAVRVTTLLVSRAHVSHALINV